ncbi:MAG TPA: hypothetical protein VGP58_05285 [Pyrinomonadaceae bacterium]|jgi:hypothetical protein|nr:hypothetical protein [Pyrinomonadaceae bacterium]
MKSENNQQIEIVEELPDSWWYRVYLAAIITTIIVISALGTFTRYFSD